MKRITLLDFNKNRTRKTKRWLGLLTFCMMVLAGINYSAQAQLANSYSIDVSNGTYSSISGTGTSIPALVADNGSVNITDITPGFTVNGVTYTSARMNSNGWLALYSGTAPTTTTETALLSTAVASTGGSTVVFAPLNVDLIQSEVATCAVYAETIGDEHIFEWANFSRYNLTVANRTDAFNFQLRLNHVTGEIKFVYGTMTIGAVPVQAPRVGWKTNGQIAANWATDINNLMLNVTGSSASCNWNDVVTGNSNTSEMYLNATNSGVAPTSGLTYTWTPPVVAVDPVRTFATVTDITDNSATLGWTASTGATEYNVRYRAVGSCSWTNFSGNPVNTNSTTLIGLDPNTNYQIQVQASNGTNNSVWSHIPTGASGTGLNGYTATGTFQTALPTCTGTPNAGTISGDTVRPACGGSTPSPSTVTVTGQTSDSSQITFQWESSLDDETWVDATGTGNATITYTIPAHTAGEIEYYRLRVTCSASGLSSYSDVLQVTDYVAPDTQATNVATSVLGNTTATVTWTNGNGNRRFVVINTINSFTDPTNGSGPALTAAAAYSGSGEQIVYDGTGTSVAVTGLSPVTTYYVRVYEYRRCGSSAPYTYYYQTSTGTDNPGSFTTDLYCSVSTTNTSDYISAFSTTGGTQNTSYTATSQPAGSYSDQTAQVISQAQGLSVDFSSTFVGGAWGLKIWVDVDNDGVFDDATETVFFLANSDATKTGTITIPVSLPTGDYRVRVRGQYGATANPPACGNVSYGSTIDFTLQVLPAPDCMPVTALTATGITHNQAVLGWTSDGADFDIEFVEVGTTPTGTPTDAGVSNPFTTTATLTPSTDYEFYVRQDCGGIYSTWTGPFAFTTECLPPSILTTTTGEICGQGTVELSATAEAGATIAWYTAQTGGTKLGEGEDFTTPLINTTTSYWVEASTGSSEVVGPASPTVVGGTIATQTIAWNVNFTVTENTTLTSIDIFPMTSGQNGTIQLRQGTTTTVIATVPYTTSVNGGTTAQTIELNFELAPGTYNLYPGTLPSGGIRRNESNASYPYTSSVASITGNGYDANYFMGFYNWIFGSKCASVRTEIVATVTAPPAFALSSTEVTICEGETTSAVTITTGAADYDTYVWSPATGVTGDATTGWTFNPAETTTYTLTASQMTGTECIEIINFMVNINTLPATITINASEDNVCENSIVELSVSGNSNSGTAVFGESTSVPGNTSWPNPFSKWYGGTKHQMLFTSDELSSQGLIAGSEITAVTFDIAAINTSANNVCTDFTIRMGTTSVTEMTGFVSGTIDVYGPSSFTPTTTGIVTFDLTTAYVWDGLSNIVVETVHNTGNGGGGSGTNTRATTTANNSVYRAAKDNVAGGIAGFDADNFTTGTYAVGSNNLRPNMTFIHSIEQNLITWSPAINLYTDVEATTAYVADTYATTVYFKSSSVGDFTYTATSYTDAGCNISDDVEITVNEAPEAPVTACYEIATFNPATCQWDITGEQPEQPAITCYETAEFNAVTCEWEITGTQPAAPTGLACYETATFNDTTCEWDVTGDQPEQPVLACYETATFNDATCEWDITGEQPEQPVLECYETATFNDVTCQWDITGEQPATPTADSPQTLSEGQTVADIVLTDVTGTLTWYDADGNVVDDSTALTEGSYTFWVTQTIDGCESDAVQVEVEVTLSTNVFDNASFKAYPNPVKDFFNVSYSKDITNVTVINMLGQTVITQAVNSTATQIDMTGLPTGSYFVKVTADGAVKTVKVIKQ